MGRKQTWTTEQLKEAIEKASGWGEVCRLLGLTDGTPNRKHLRKKADELGIDHSHLMSMS